MNLYGSATPTLFYFMITAAISTWGLISSAQAQSVLGNTKRSTALSSPPLQASETYNLTFYNNSNYLPATVTKKSSHCMEPNKAGPDSFTIPAGGNHSFEIQDSNNLFMDCTNIEKTIEWALSNNNGQSRNVSFNHYTCSKDKEKIALCAVIEAVKGWRTKIVTEGALVDSATCDDKYCLNTAVNDGAKIPDITIKVMSAYQARLLAISSPGVGRYPANYSFSPSGTATPGATISLSLSGCPAGRTTDCNMPTVTADGNGNWSVAPRLLGVSSGYTLTVNQMIDGYEGPNNPQNRAFTVYDARVNTQIVSPPDLSWLPTGVDVIVQGTVTPRADTSKVRCYVDGRDTGPSTAVYGDGSWECRHSALQAGKHTFSGRVEPEHTGDQDTTFTYIVATPLGISSPLDNTTQYPPLQFAGTQQPGSVVRYTSDRCGNGIALSNGDTWTASPFNQSGVCTFSFTQNWLGMTSSAITRRVTLKQKPRLISPSVVEQDTPYPLTGTGEPGSTLEVSLSDGWFPIDQVTVDRDGRWTSEPGPMSGSGEYTLSLKQILVGFPDISTETPLIVEDNDSATPENTGTEK